MTDSRTPRRVGALALVFALAFGLLAGFATKHRSSYDGFIMTQVAISIAEDGTPLVHPIDRFGLNTPYSGYGIGSSLVMTPFYVAADAIGVDWLRAMRLANPLLYAATVVGLIVLLNRRGYPTAVVAGVTALFAVGTPLVHYAILDFAEPGVALTVVLALIALDATDRGSRWGPLSVGAAVGGAVLFRTDSWLLVIAPVLVCLSVMATDRWRSVGMAALGIAPSAIVWATYNEARFGSVLTSGYSNQPFSNPMLKGLYGLTLSPGRGVFVYVPILLVAIAIVPRLQGSARTLGTLAVAMLVLRVLLYSRWWSWYGGDSWGPRFMVPALPAFAPLVAEALTRWHRARIVVVCVAATAMMGLIGFGVAIDALPYVYGQAPYDFTVLDRTPQRERGALLVHDWTSAEFLSRTNASMFDWSRFPARRSQVPPVTPTRATRHAAAPPSELGAEGARRAARSS